MSRESTSPGTLQSSESLPVLELEDLTIDVEMRGRKYRAVDALSMTIAPRQAMGLVGESGSGKSLSLRAIMGLLPPNVEVAKGKIRFQGQDLLADKGARLRQVRGTGISMVFQEPAVSLNPIAKVGRQITDSAAEHRNLGKRAAREYAIHLMERVGIPEPHKRVDSYPFELSGGMRQRVMIAAAVACEPKLLLCDEPTTALDVTVQAQILRLFAGLRDELNAGLLYVTHDLAVVAQLCDSLTVLYAGQVTEAGKLRALFDDPQHPYTKALLNSTPRIDGPLVRLTGIPETQPALTDRPVGGQYPRHWSSHGANGTSGNETQKSEERGTKVGTNRSSATSDAPSERG